MKTILLAFKPEEFSPAVLAQVRALLPDRQVLLTTDPAEMEAHLADIEIVAGNIPHELLLRFPNLRWSQQWGAGVDWLMKSPAAVEQDWLLTNGSGIHAVPISEHILALMFAFARGLPAALRLQQQHAWKSTQRPSLFEMEGRTLLLVGVGAIGERTARKAAALGMRVWGVRRSPEVPVEGVSAMFAPEQLLQLLPEADFVVLTAPLTQATRGMIGAAELRAMKPTAYLINIGRGGTVDTAALIAALQAGQIAGAGLDVVDPEPLPPDSPLWDMPNVILTGHYAGHTPYYFERAAAIFLDNLQRYRDGQPLRNLVNKTLGY